MRWPWRASPPRLLVLGRSLAWWGDSASAAPVLTPSVSPASIRDSSLPDANGLDQLLSAALASLGPQPWHRRRWALQLTSGWAQACPVGPVAGLGSWSEAQSLAEQRAQQLQEWGEPVHTVLNDAPDAHHAALALYCPRRLLDAVQMQSRATRFRCVSIAPWWVEVFNRQLQSMAGVLTQAAYLFAFKDLDGCMALVLDRGNLLATELMSATQGDMACAAWLQRLALVHGVTAEHLLRFDGPVPTLGRALHAPSSVAGERSA